MNLIQVLKTSLRKVISGVGIFDKPAMAVCVDNELLPGIIARTPSKDLRAMLRLPEHEQVTQLNQDVFALLINRFQEGFFVEVGANDGYTLSNTVYLEEKFGWSGILIEPNERYQESLSTRGRSVVINKAVSSTEGSAEFVDAGLYGGLRESLGDTYKSITDKVDSIEVECMYFEGILDLGDAPEVVDFISIDVEGGEVEIVKQMVSSRRRFKCGCIEHNDRAADYHAIMDLLKQNGYEIVWEGQTKHDLYFMAS